MSDQDFNALLQSAFKQCELFGHPLDDDQKQILIGVFSTAERSIENPLAQLTPDQRQALLSFIAVQQTQGKTWKTILLNDWLENRDSGTVQFVREIYGLQWLETITPAHLAEYAEDTMPLKVGDRIEVSNTLWEWVQNDDRDWYSCVVIGLTSDPREGAIVRFENGQEFEIQGVYDWNRSNWRWKKNRQ